MLRRGVSLDELDVFADLPATHIAMGDGSLLGVHVAGRIDDARPPVICLAGYVRNMADYADFITTFQRLTDSDWPVVLVDLRGRGRSSKRRKMADYTTVNDAADVASICDALGIEQAVFIGQGHGGQVLMALAETRSRLIAGSVLIDCGPITDTPGLVRLRDNMEQLNAMKGERQFRAIARQIYGLAHPGATEDELDQIADRTHLLRKNGRVRPLFDPALLKRLADIQFEDVFEPQWILFDLLSTAPMMLVRTQLTDSLQRATFERMGDIRSDAIQIIIPGQGTPALLTGEDEVGAIADFCQSISKQLRLRPIVSG